MQMQPLLPPVLVNGVTLDPARIAAEAQNHPAPKGKPGAAWQAAARALALRELLLQQARAAGVAAEPAEVAPGQVETEEEALIRQVLERALDPDPADPAQLREIYDSQPDRFRAPSLFEAAHILVPIPPDDPVAAEEARKTATALLAELQRDPQPFADLAARYSACSSRTSGGSLGQLSSGDTVAEFELAMERMDVGEIGLVESRYGLHILRLDARQRGNVLPFETVLPRLIEAHDKAAWLRASRDYVTKLVAAADISGVAF
ncbi:MAG: peptidylprolyl isomerase [Rhodobacteraceae bacterium]|jgi:peptidyl-prolyl cis-trans isomerase C|nr:peptidylprolyl isomerase [Paracoccaceae bacterium]